MATLAELKAELKPYKNTLVIDQCSHVSRLVDVVFAEDDYYWVHDRKNKLSYQSCVGGWIPLKGFIDKNQYERMVRVWNLNHSEQAI